MSTAPAKDRVAAFLGDAEAPGPYCAKRTATTGDLHLAVEGVGTLTFPVPDQQARQLCHIGRPARYGLGEQTLLDLRVRDTWEIPKRRIKIDKRSWNQTLRPVLDKLSCDLGIPAGALKAEFHSMLLYAKGQFFAPHQDTEKTDGMVGSLVVTLPSRFTGGELVVRQGARSRRFRSTKNSLSFVAFYADCRHEVKPVKSGFRIVLTYNLLLDTRSSLGATAGEDPESVQQLAGLLAEHSAVPRSLRPGEAEAGPPNRLVYLLDHEYTSHSLVWGSLKSSDARRAGLLAAAAEVVGCEIALALADVHETWNCLGPEEEWSPYSFPSRSSPYGHRSEDFGWDADLDDADEDFDFDGGKWRHGDDVLSVDDYQLEDLVDWETTIDGAVDRHGQPSPPLAARVYDWELCSSTPSVEMTPYTFEYQGYMGNYGNTLDRWYHRAAVVLWPQARSFSVHAEASANWALDQLDAVLGDRQLATAREMATTLGPFWEHVVRDDQKKSLTKALRIARTIDDADLGSMLLRPFMLETVTSANAAGLAAVTHCYGEAWAADLLATWTARQPRWPGATDRLEWIARMDSLCRALAPRAGGTATASLLLRACWARLEDTIDAALGLVAPSTRRQSLADAAPAVAGLMGGAAAIGATDLLDAVVERLSRDDSDLIPCSLAVLRAVAPRRGPMRSRSKGRPSTGDGVSGEERHVSQFDALASDCARLLRASVARPQRAAGDWSIPPPPGCECDRCATLGDFLADAGRRIFEWPLAKDSRAHVHHRLDAAEIPSPTRPGAKADRTLWC